MKRIVFLTAGPYIAPSSYPIATDTDHNGFNEIIFYTQSPTRWEVWEYRPTNQYQLVYVDTGGYPYPPGITTGNFEPKDVGDIDRDGLIDLVGPNIDQPQNPDTVYYAVTTQESPNYTSYPESLSWWYRYSNNFQGDGSTPFYFPGDLDQDDSKELLFMCCGTGITYVFENRGNNQNELVWSRYQVGACSFAFNDFDLDGRKEFATANLGSLGKVSVYENTGPDQYEMTYQDTVRIANGADVFSGNDLDGDGKPEFFIGFAQYVGGNNWDFYLYMWEATGNNTYQRNLVAQRRITAISSTGRRSKCGDIDGDGIEELVWATPTTVYAFKATGNNQFTQIWQWNGDHGDDEELKVNVYDVNENRYNEIIVTGSNRTSIFEVEAVWLRRPNGGEIFVGNTQEQIRWQKFYPPRCDSLSLFYSLNSGRTYDTIITGIPGADSSYLWTVPDTSSDSCKVKVIAYGPGWQYDESDGVFTITPSGISEIASPTLAMTSVEISPNPAKGKIRFKIWNANQDLFLKIYNLAGELVKTFSLTTNNQKLTTFLWDGKDDSGKKLPAGIYVYRLKTADGFSETKEFIYLR